MHTMQGAPPPPNSETERSQFHHLYVVLRLQEYVTMPSLCSAGIKPTALCMLGKPSAVNQCRFPQPHVAAGPVGKSTERGASPVTASSVHCAVLAAKKNCGWKC